jgi:Bacterial PH domain
VTDRETFRLAPPVVFWWAWLVFVAANVVDYAVQGLPSARFCAVVASILLLVTGLVFTLALRPRVIAAGDGITVVNPYRTHFVPWRRVTAVDTGEWVEVHYEPARGETDSGSGPASSAGSSTVHCWALYVSGRSRRQISGGPRRPRDELPRGLRGALRDGRRGAGPAAPAPRPSRLPEEARYLASLPPAKAIAVRLDSQAGRERARAAGQDSAGQDSAGQATAAWNWPAVAAVVAPALILASVAAA